MLDAHKGERIMRRMYKISKGISYGFAGLAVTAGMMTMGIDVDMTHEVSLPMAYAIMLSVTAVLAFISWVFADITRITRVVVPVSVVVCAWTYIAFRGKLHIKSFRTAYEIKKRCRTYKNTYRYCQKLYMDMTIKELLNADDEDELY